MIKSEKKKVLVVQVGKIGDMILTTPLFSGLKKIFPQSEIYVLTSKVNNEIAERDPDVTGTIIYKKNFISVLKLISKLKKIKFDYWIDTKDEFSSTSKTLLKFGKFEKSLGFNTKENLFGISLKDFVKGTHTVDINLSPVAYFNNEIDLKQFIPRINIPEAVRDKIKNIFGSTDRKKILINISAGAENRYWKTEKWLELMHSIDTGNDIYMISDFKDRHLAEKIEKNYKSGNLTYIHAASIFEVAEIVKSSDVIVTPDTSIVHIASCFNKPIVAMFHNVEWVLQRYAPLSETSRVIISKEKDSISDVKVSDVVSALKEIILQIRNTNI
ncbi:MAG: glycosyltransferase family 9 protein [Ignavibacteriae bacterium]|nr:glycosyltransferase family 9 protein [Ignavibacteriota bacterium]